MADRSGLPSSRPPRRASPSASSSPALAGKAPGQHRREGGGLPRSGPLGAGNHTLPPAGSFRPPSPLRAEPGSLALPRTWPRQTPLPAPGSPAPPSGASRNGREGAMVKYLAGASRAAPAVGPGRRSGPAFPPGGSGLSALEVFGPFPGSPVIPPGDPAAGHDPGRLHHLTASRADPGVQTVAPPVAFPARGSVAPGGMRQIRPLRQGDVFPEAPRPGLHPGPMPTLMKVAEGWLERGGRALNARPRKTTWRGTIR